MIIRNIEIRRLPLRPSFIELRKLKGKAPLRIAEIGVHLGENAAIICRNFKIEKLYLIDPYLSYFEYKDFGLSGNVLAADLQNAKREAHKKLDCYSFVQFIEKKSADAAKEIPSNSLDIIYIDGNHTYDFVDEEINLYLPKLKKGGILAGHNWDRFGVIDAVCAHFSREQIHVNTNDWWVVKA